MAPQALFSLPQAVADYVLKLRGPRMADGAQLVLKGYEPGRYWILAEFASATGGSERIGSWKSSTDVWSFVGSR